MKKDITEQEAFLQLAALCAQAEHCEQEMRDKLKRFLDDFKEGMSYLRSEKGLLAVAIYFLFSSMRENTPSRIYLLRQL